MRFLSVCSGIEAASVAWHPLGWEPVAFSEIEPFPCAVLTHHYPNVPNWGDMTKFTDWPDATTVDLLCGGTPCQSFSVAGLRKGLDDPRGNLMLTFGAIAARYRPRWLVWENVPGVLSSNKGRDFGAFLGLLGLLGYGFAYRVLDAQYFGLAQRRKRVFVVGCLGDWRRAAAVLFERQSLSGHPAPSREAWKGAPAGALRSTDGGSDVNHARAGHLLAFGWNRTSGPRDVASALSAHGGTGRHDFETETFITHSLRGEGFDASEDGTGRGTPLVPVAFPANLSATQHATTANLAPSMGAKNPTAVAHVNVAPTMRAGGNQTGGDRPPGTDVDTADSLLTTPTMQVRRLTPRECERLMGFPDDYTLVPLPLNGRQTRVRWASDSARYKALGNSWAVPCARWIGQRIQAVEAITGMEEAA